MKIVNIDRAFLYAMRPRIQRRKLEAASQKGAARPRELQDAQQSCPRGKIPLQICPLGLSALFN